MYRKARNAASAHGDGWIRPEIEPVSGFDVRDPPSWKLELPVHLVMHKVTSFPEAVREIHHSY